MGVVASGVQCFNNCKEQSHKESVRKTTEENNFCNKRIELYDRAPTSPSPPVPHRLVSSVYSNMFWSLFIFRGHSVRGPASSRVTYFILYLIPCMIRYTTTTKKEEKRFLTHPGQSVLLRSILTAVTDRQYGQYVTWLSRLFLLGTKKRKGKKYTL